MPSDENAEIFSWCPFAGRPNDPQYTMCYEPDEEHKPRVFTVRELCNHVYDSHQGMYLSFCKHIKHHIKECLCEKDGRRIVVSSTPLDSTYIISEMRKFVDEKYTALAQAGEFIAYASMDGKSIVDAMKPDHNTEEVKVPTSPYPEPEQLIGKIIDNIQQLLKDTPSWTGSMTELHSKISCVICDDITPPTPRALGKLLTGLKDRLVGHDIRCLRSAGHVVLQRTVNGKFELIGSNLKVIKTHTSTPQAKIELRKTIEEPAHTTATESDNAKTTSDMAHTDTKLSYQSGYKLSMQLDALPKDVREKIEMDFKRSVLVPDICQYLNNITHGKPQISTITLRAYMERHHITRSDRALKEGCQWDKSGKMAEVVIDSIQQLLSDNPVWIGTPTELHSTLRTDDTFFPADPSRMSYTLNRIKKRLLNSDIQVSRHPRSSLSKTLYGIFRDSRSQVIIALQRKVDGKFKSLEELCANLAPKTPDHIIEAACETIPDAQISAPIVKNHSIEVIGLSVIKNSMIKIPDEVVSRIGVEDGDRVIFMDDGENIIIKPAKYNLN